MIKDFISNKANHANLFYFLLNIIPHLFSVHTIVSFRRKKLRNENNLLPLVLKNNVHLIRVGSSYIFYFPTHLYILNCKLRTNTLHGTVIAVLLPDRRNLFYVQSKIHTDCFWCEQSICKTIISDRLLSSMKYFYRFCIIDIS